jgi:pimeloyl-ACP methyl ester carboxylesterase
MIFADKIEKAYRQQMFGRCDDTGIAYYFSADDFKGLNKESFVFKAKAGHNLQGYFYWYDNPVENRIVVFEHGMGGGHRSYMREIETIAKKGYLVFAYDHTGCMESGGENTNGFGQSLSDLDCAITALKNSEKCKDMDISVIGHSWGGFSTLNIPALHPDLKHIVAMCGFISVNDMIKQQFSGILRLFAKHIFELEKRSNPDTVDFNAVKSLETTEVKCLVIYSDNDPLVKKECHYDVLKTALDGRENIEFMLAEGKFHSPNYTFDAVKYKDEFFATLTKKLKNKQLETPQQKAEFVASYDWWRMTQQDMDVWERIFGFIAE